MFTVPLGARAFAVSRMLSVRHRRVSFQLGRNRRAFLVLVVGGGAI
jgi:hypothetical protein